MAKSSAFRKKQLEQKGLLGILLSYTVPNVASTAAKTSNALATQNGKRMKTDLPSGSNRILIFGNAHTACNDCFCIVLPFKDALHRKSFCSHTLLEASVGDTFLIYEPSVTERPLGKEIPIITGFRCIVPLKRNVFMPPKPFTMSPEANHQIYFQQHNVTVEFSCMKILTGKEFVPCHGTFCDRQNAKCTGCFGLHLNKRNFVFSVEVEILDQPGYNETGIACFTFRSFHLTSLFVTSIEKFCAIDPNLMDNLTDRIRPHVQLIQDYVNTHGGWTAIGWHRRGLLPSNEDYGTEMNMHTDGHLIRLEPTNASPATLTELKKSAYNV